MKAAPVQVKNVLVTGCSSGIGLATARVLRSHGWQVAPTARKREDLEMLRADGFNPVEMDVVDELSVERGVKQVLAQFDGKIGAVVNNAGFGQAGAIEDLSRELLRYQFEVNVFGAHDVTRRLVPIFRKQGWGRIVNISSVLGRVVIPFYGSYCATKYALEALSDALRVELCDSGVAVSLIEPGPIVSQFRQTAADQLQKTMKTPSAAFGEFYTKEIERRVRQQKKPDPFTRPPEDVAEKILHAIESSRPKTRYCVTIPAYMGALAARFAPTWVLDAVNSRKLRK